jgi:adenylate cyclase
MMRAVGEPSSGAQVAEATRRRCHRTGWVVCGVGSLVVVAAIGFLIPIFVSDPDDSGRIALINLPFMSTYFVLAGVLITRVTNRRFDQAVGWLADGRPPDKQERRLTLGFGVYSAKVVACTWIVAGVAVLALNAAAYSPEFAAVVATAIWLGGETTCAILYLIQERNLRPVTARALAARPPSRVVTPGVRDRLLVVWVLGTGVPLLGVLMVGVVGLANPDVESEYVAAAALFLGVVASAAGLLATAIAARTIADPLTAVRSAVERVEDGDLDARVTVDDGSEVGLLQAGFNRMADGLREREQIRDLFGRQVGRDVARAALRDPPRLGGEEREVGVLYVDLVGSTSMALAMPPTEVVRLLNLFFRVVVETVEERRGLVNKFEGDAALCVFGAPVASDDPAGEALAAARELSARLRSEVPQVDFGIGVSAGRAVAGNVGAEQRFEYTVIGDPVNEAARLSRLARQHSERVVSSEAALRRAAGEETAAWSLGEPTILAGRAEQTGIALPRAAATGR